MATITTATFSRPLTDAEMERIKAVADPRNPEAAIIEFYDVALGDVGSSYANEESIEPREFVIPEDQWGEICKWLMGTDGDVSGVERINGGLVWMNVGPSTIPW